MAYDLEEQESLDQLKAWWEKWGTPITVVITVACLAFAGYNGYRYYEKNQGAKATAAYVQLQNAVVMDEKKNIKSLSEGLMKEYPKHVFASLAAFSRCSRIGTRISYGSGRTAAACSASRPGISRYAP